MRDGPAFIQFLVDESSIRLSIEFRGGLHSIEYVLYKWLRCTLVHEGEIPFDIEFTDANDLWVRAGGTPNFTLQLSRGWFWHLIDSVRTAPEYS